MVSFFSNKIQTQTFSHGVHPKEFKSLSAKRRTERMPFVKHLTIPLAQHIGAPSVSIVRKGQYVKRGEMIAKPGGYVSVAQHSPVDGTVIGVELYDHPNGQLLPGIKIETDQFSTQTIQKRHIELPEKKEDFIKAVQMAGIVGMGGAGFPSHVKFSIPDGKSCDFLMINGCECEPFLTCDHRLMLESVDELVGGIEILQKYIKAERVYIGIENNKQDAIDLLQRRTRNNAINIEVVPFEVKYPQGAEKMMITAILDEEIPTGKLPIDIGVLVVNVATTAALYTYFNRSQPLIERIVTVTGTAVVRPSNLIVPIGTPMNDVVDFCGGVTSEANRMLLGGPMMGIVQKSLDSPIMKGTSGILVLTANEVHDLSTYQCIRCGKCVDACPLFLNPARLGLLARKGLWDEMEEYNALDCFECAACSYVCPSGIPLVQSIRVGKGMIREKRARVKE